VGLAALPSIADDAWIPMVKETDVLLVNGGDPLPSLRPEPVRLILPPA
jgi:hypothetical protein